MNFIYWYGGILAVLMACIYFCKDGTVQLKIVRALMSAWFILAGVVLYAGIFILPFWIHPNLDIDLGLIVIKDGFTRFILVAINAVALYLLIRYVENKIRNRKIKSISK